MKFIYKRLRLIIRTNHLHHEFKTIFINFFCVFQNLKNTREKNELKYQKIQLRTNDCERNKVEKSHDYNFFVCQEKNSSLSISNSQFSEQSI